MLRSKRHIQSNRLLRSVAAAVERMEGRVLLSSYTVTNLNDSGAGSLRDAIQQANAHSGADTVTFASGLTGTITLTSGEITATDDLTTVTGPGASVLAVSGGVLLSAFGGAMHGPALDISGLTLDRVSGDGLNTQLTLADCGVRSVDTLGQLVIRRCTVSGGGIVAHGGFDISDSTISHSAAGVGDGRGDAAAIVLPLGAIGGSLTNCTISDNPGDGIFASDGGVSLTGCIVSNNGQDGIFSNEEFIEVMNSTVTGNSGAGIAGVGLAALLVQGSTVAGNKDAGISGGQQLTMSNSTVANNMGGGITGIVGQGRSTITNSTIAGNVATTVAGIAVGGITVINNTIVAGNRDANGDASDVRDPGQFVTGANNLFGTGGSGGLVNGQNGNIVGVNDPMLAPLGDYGGPTQTMPPLAGGPAIDAGSNASAVDENGKPLTTDQRGYNRIFNSTVDIGADEFGFAPANPVVTNLNASGPGSLSQAILDTNIHIGPDTITFAPGLSGTIADGGPTITDDLTITGPGRSVLAVNGGFSLDVYAYQIPWPHAALDLSGLTINGEVSGGDAPGAPITASDCAIGGVDNYNDSVLRRCIISGGRGIVAHSLLQASDCTISNSAAGTGDVARDTAAIYVPAGGNGAYLTNCTITNNPGDGVFAWDSFVSLTHCTVSDNKGVGVFNDGSTVQLFDSTVSGSGTSGMAGGEADFFVSGSTVANNKAPA